MSDHAGFKTTSCLMYSVRTGHAALVLQSFLTGHVQAQTDVSANTLNKPYASVNFDDI